MSAGADRYLRAVPADAALCSASGGYWPAVAEHLLAMLLHLQKKLHLYTRNQLRETWRDEGLVRAVSGSTVLVAGLGDIGGEFARRVHLLGASVLGVHRRGGARPPFVDELHTAEALNSLLPRADVVALSLPAGHPLWRAPNTLITPHVAGGNHLAATFDRVVDIAVSNVRALAAGEPLRNVVDRAAGY